MSDSDDTMRSVSSKSDEIVVPETSRDSKSNDSNSNSPVHGGEFDPNFPPFCTQPRNESPDRTEVVPHVEAPQTHQTPKSLSPLHSDPQYPAVHLGSEEHPSWSSIPEFCTQPRNVERSPAAADPNDNSKNDDIQNLITSVANLNVLMTNFKETVTNMKSQNDIIRACQTEIGRDVSDMRSEISKLSGEVASHSEKLDQILLAMLKPPSD